MVKTPTAGSAAPDIRLPDQDGKTQTLGDRRGKWVLVYFYPRDDTPGCTAEACGLRDVWAEYRAHGIEVLGISADSSRRHRKFADKYDLPFTLLADEDKGVIRAYGAWGRKKFMGREFDGIFRHSFLIDPKGKIAKVYTSVKPAAHAAEVLADVKALSKGGAPKAPARNTSADAAPVRKRSTKPRKKASRKA